MSLKELAEEYNMKLSTLEKEANLPLNSIYKYNKGIITPNIETCVKIANALHINWQIVVSLFYYDIINSNTEILIKDNLT